MKKLLKILKFLVWSAILLFLALIVASFLPIKGNYKILTVQSGSMEPSIYLGSLIFVKSSQNYQVGDIVTRKTDDPKTSITHRIISQNSDNTFETKGDANDSADGESLNREKIIGKVFLTIPYIGYPIGYARTVPGFIILVVVPTVIIIYEELRKIKGEVVKKFKKKKYPDDADNILKDAFIRAPREDNVGSIVFESKENSLKEKFRTGRKMDL
jgi:signal peptidase